MSFVSAGRAVLEAHVSAGRCFDMVITHGRCRIVRRLSRRKVLRIWKKRTVKSFSSLAWERALQPPRFARRGRLKSRGTRCSSSRRTCGPSFSDEAGTFDVAMLSRFFEVQRPDCLMLAEGIGACGLDAAASRGVAVGMLAAARSEAEASVARSSGAPFDFAITISGRSPAIGGSRRGSTASWGRALPLSMPPTPRRRLQIWLPSDLALCACGRDARPCRLLR